MRGPGGIVSRVTPLIRRAASVAEHELARRGRRARLRPDTVFFESFGGNGLLCNPEAIFRALLAAPDLRPLRLVWTLGPADDPARADFAENSRVRFVRRRSPQYYRELGSAGYLVNNATFPQAFAKRPGQVYLNTWHGTPLKAMGYDMPGGGLESVNIVRNLLAADYLLAPNERTERMYLDAYRLRELFAGALLRVGTPRMDRNVADAATRERTLSRLRDGGVDVPAGRQIVLFAPTWRGSFERPDDDLDRVCSAVAAMAMGLEPEFRLLVKIHQRVYAKARADPRLAGRLVPNHLPTNDVLAIADVLVSDYSSVLVDYLTTQRPIVIYAPDAADYQHTRGLYTAVDELPGPVCTAVADVVDAVHDLAHREVSPAYHAFRQRFCPAEDGHATERVVDVVFRNRTAAGQVERRPRSTRTRLLFYCGGMQANGVTSSALSLLRHLDYERYDVTVSYPASGGTPDIVGALDDRARILPRLGGTTWGRVRHTPFPVVGGRLPFDRRRLLRDVYLDDEWRRCFGDARFDTVVDFGGYSAFFAKLLSFADASWRATWLHNDIHAEMSSRGRSPWLRANLRRMTSMYGLSQRLVSVSAELAQLNAARLSGRGVEPDRFVFARNTVDADRIHDLAAQTPATDAQGRALLSDAPGTRTFITVGRLTQAKNHRRLIAAFARVHASCPQTRLVVVGGGPLLEQLQQDVAELGLTEAVVLAGQQANPYALMARSDCFVLSSDYEGQPVVLLEAQALGLPVITTEFDSVSGALPPGVGAVVARDDAALATAMHDFLDGRVLGVALDSAAYNRAVMAEFYRAVTPEG